MEKNGAAGTREGSSLKDLNGSSWAGGAEPACENMRVNAPGSDAAGGLGGEGDAGSREAVAGVLWNIRVKSPGPDEGGGADVGAGDGAAGGADIGAAWDGKFTLAGLSLTDPKS